MSESPQETRIKLKTSFQDSYLEERAPRSYPDQQALARLVEEVRQAEAEVELQKATHQFLIKQMKTPTNRKIKPEIVNVACDFLEKATDCAEGLIKLNRWEKE